MLWVLIRSISARNKKDINTVWLKKMPTLVLQIQLTYPGTGFCGSTDRAKFCRNVSKCWPFCLTSFLGTDINLRPVRTVDYTIIIL